MNSSLPSGGRGRLNRLFRYSNRSGLIVLGLGCGLSVLAGPLVPIEIPWPEQRPASMAIATEESALKELLNDSSGTVSFAVLRLQKLVKQQDEFFRDVNHKNNPSKDPALQQRGQALVAAYEGLITENPDFVLAYLMYGKLLRRVGQDQQAYTIFLKADELDGTIPVVKQQLAALLAENGRFEEGLLFALEAVSLSPQTAIYHYQLAELLYIYRDHFVEQGIFGRDTLEAKLIQAFDQAVQLAPQVNDYRLRRAKAYFHLERAEPKQALAYWDAALTDASLGLETEAIQLHRASLLADLGRHKEARAVAQAVTHYGLQASRQQVLDQLE